MIFTFHQASMISRNKLQLKIWLSLRSRFSLQEPIFLARRIKSDIGSWNISPISDPGKSVPGSNFQDFRTENGSSHGQNLARNGLSFSIARERRESCQKIGRLSLRVPGVPPPPFPASRMARSFLLGARKHTGEVLRGKKML